MFFKKKSKLEEIKKLEKEISTKEYKNKLEELLLTPPNKDVEIKDNINEKNKEQIEVLLLLSKIKQNSTAEEVIYLKEAINYGSFKAGLFFLKKYCHIYPEDSIKIFNLLNNCSEEEFCNEIFIKEENKDKLKKAQKKYFNDLNKNYYSYSKLIYLNSFVGISYLKLNKINLAEKHLKIVTEKLLNITDEMIISIHVKPGISIGLLNLGIINYKRKNLKEAKKYFQKCNSREKDSNYFLAMIALEENDILSAISYFMKDDISISKINLVILKLKNFFSYNEIDECIEILEKEGTLDIDGKNLLGELYLMKKERTFNLKYKEKTCYEFGCADNIERLEELLKKGIEEKDVDLINGLAVLRNRIKGDIDINKISIKASDYLKEIEGFNKIEKELIINEDLENRQYIYRKKELTGILYD